MLEEVVLEKKGEISFNAPENMIWVEGKSYTKGMW